MNIDKVNPDFQTVIPVTEEIKCALIRRTPRSLYLDLAKWLSSLEIKHIISHQQSESDGHVTITLFYK